MNYSTSIIGENPNQGPSLFNFNEGSAAKNIVVPYVVVISETDSSR